MKIYRQEKFRCPPEAVLIDLDNTLYSYDEAHRAAMKAVKEKLTSSLAISSEGFDSAYLASRENVKRRLSGVAASHNRLLYFQGMLELIGLKSQPLLALDLEQTYWRAFLEASAIFEGVMEFLNELRLMGIQSALVTDLTSQIQLRKVVFFGLDRRIDFIVTSEEAGAEKPNPAPFQLALGKLGLVERPIWMIGDSVENDVHGSREAIGAITIQKIHKGVKSSSGQHGPDATFREFTDLRKFLVRLGQRREN